jgi:hypothetical protein
MVGKISLLSIIAKKFTGGLDEISLILTTGRWV